MYSSNKRMAGDDEFQANLQNAQMQNEAQENKKTAENRAKMVMATPASKGNDSSGDEPNKDPQDFLKGAMDKYSRGSDLQDKGEGEVDRSFADDLDPELAKQFRDFDFENTGRVGHGGHCRQGRASRRLACAPASPSTHGTCLRQYS